MLRTRTSRREDPLDENADNAGSVENVTHVPDPVIARADRDPESEAMLADSVGLALLVVLETLEPAERLAFVLHDVFGMTFEEIAPIVDRSAVAARQLASRARRRVRSRAPNADPDLNEQRRAIDAFMAAAQEGDFERLVAVLDPDIVLRADGGALAGLSRVVRGAREVAAQAATFSRSGLSNQLVLVNGNLGFVSRRSDGRVFAVIGFTIAGGKVVEMDILADPERLGRLDLSAIA
jgi:RNA polymerase sigma-70 factor (ECF subfamily)